MFMVLFMWILRQIHTTRKQGKDDKGFSEKKKNGQIPGNIPNPGSSSKVKAKENLDDKKKTRPGRRRLHRNGKAWPGDELTGDNVYVSIHVGTEVKLNDTSSYNQNTRPGRQRLHRKEKLLAGSKVVGDSVRGSVLTAKEKKRKNETFDAKTSVVSSEESDEMIGNAVPGPVLMIQDDMLKPETSEDKAKEIVEDNKDDIRITESRSEDKVKETVGGRKVSKKKLLKNIT